MANEAEAQVKTRKKEAKEMKESKKKNVRRTLAAEIEGVEKKKGVGGSKAAHPVSQKGQ